MLYTFKMDRPLRHLWLRALGAEEMPAHFDLPDGRYTHIRTYKHDFFAATGLYSGPSGKVILKIGRTASLFGLPLRWIGRRLADHEFVLYQALKDLPGVPRCLGRWGDTGFVHLFVEGHPLQKHEWVNDEFFPRLAALLDQVHQRGIAYVDLEKRENILVGASGEPYLIDFQISWRWPDRPGDRRGVQRLLPDELGRLILARLQDSDRYHLLKHRRRHRPDTLTRQEHDASYRHGPYVALHRKLFRPLTLLRRRMLKLLTGHARSPKQDGPEFLSGHN